MLTISDFSKQSNFSIRMLRYLEEQGLLMPTRKENNYRVYQKSQLHLAAEIKNLQELGLQLKEIIELRNNENHAELLKKVLEREVDIAEIKSSTIPRLKHFISTLENTKDSNLFSILSNQEVKLKEVPIRSEAGELQRVAYSIPFLRELYEDYLAEDSRIELIETNVIYFKDLCESTNKYQVFTVLDKSSFMFGVNLNDHFITSYLENWKRFIPSFNIEKLEGFTSSEVPSLMGRYDMVIETKFKYKNDNMLAEIVIPYAPIYTMSKVGVLK